MFAYLQSLVTRWLRRRWRRVPHALAAYDGLSAAVVVTGASEGIGLAMARRFSATGATVLMIARDSARLAAAAEAVRKTTPGRIETLALDVAAPDALTRLDAALAAMRAYPDIVVNNAAIGLAGDFDEHAPADLAHIIAVNVGAVTNLCRHVLPGLIVRGRGGIINMASLGGYAPGPHQAVYYASKAYVISLSEALAAETVGRGVRITAVAPGPVDTGFHAKMGADRAFYRLVIPAHTADQIAAISISGFRWGARVVVPGVFNKILMMSVRLLPHRLILPIVTRLLRPRPQ